ncbi:four helix bundle protein [Carboxylicivirga caseinilyticus]|uniref:four helix bundle protein n=1 Tax=Carboxylicivirga caseinilyticus TaxID=3417572 RepID=UPI003D346175|nr:four helix bundle protein [Marinilabiliaceae bacterium A049]
MHDYKDLKVWQDSIDFVVSVYELTKAFPSEEIYALTSQIKRAVVSIPSNIAEGANRNTDKEFIQFLYIALGSASEVETQLIIANRLGYLENIETESDQITSIRKMINALIKSIRRRSN